MNTVEHGRRVPRDTMEIGFEQSCDGQDYMRVSRLIRQQTEEESNSDVEHKAWALAMAR